jgi:hypothetical protein
MFTGVEPAQQHRGVRGGEARDPPPAGGGGPPQLPGGGAHQPQEDRREAARGGAGIPTGACGLFVNFFKTVFLLYLIVLLFFTPGVPVFLLL